MITHLTTVNLKSFETMMKHAMILWIYNTPSNLRIGPVLLLPFVSPSPTTPTPRWPATTSTTWCAEAAWTWPGPVPTSRATRPTPATSGTSRKEVPLCLLLVLGEKRPFGWGMWQVGLWETRPNRFYSEGFLCRYCCSNKAFTGHRGGESKATNLLCWPFSRHNPTNQKRSPR